MSGAPAGAPGEWSDESLPIRTSHRAYPLPGYGRTVVNRSSLVAREPLLESLATVLRTHGTLYAWASEQPQPRALRGRAPVYVADLPDTDVTLVVRHAWHGGVFAPLTRDLYLHPTRAPIELVRTIMLRQMEIGTPEFLGYALYPAGPAISRVDVATRFVDHAYDLGAVLADHAPELSRASAMDAVEALLVKLAAYGVVHPDLNVKNILLRADRGAISASIIDVDVVRWLPEQRPSLTMLANVARLARSMRKWRKRFGIALPDDELNALVARLMAAAPQHRASFATSTAPPVVGGRDHAPRTFE